MRPTPATKPRSKLSGANIQLMEYHLSNGAHRHLDNSVLELNLAENARLRHVRIQAGNDGATYFLHTDGELHAHAHYLRVDVELGGGLVRHELNVRLRGNSASLTANGVLPANGRRHIETRLGIEHHARDTRCNLNWRGIATGRGRVVFHGGITIHPGADGTEAALSSKNLLLTCCSLNMPKSIPSRYWSFTPMKSRPRTVPPSVSLMKARCFICVRAESRSLKPANY